MLYQPPRRGCGQSSADLGNRSTGIPPHILAQNRLQHIKEQRRNTCGELSGDDLKELDIESIVWGAGLNFSKAMEGFPNPASSFRSSAHGADAHTLSIWIVNGRMLRE